MSGRPLFGVEVWGEKLAGDARGAVEDGFDEGCDVVEVHLAFREGTDEEAVVRWLRMPQAAEGEDPVGGVVLTYCGFEGGGKSDLRRLVGEELVEDAEVFAEVPSRLVVGDEDLTFGEFLKFFWHGGRRSRLRVLFFRAEGSTRAGAKQGGRVAAVRAALEAGLTLEFSPRELVAVMAEAGIPRDVPWHAVEDVLPCGLFFAHGVFRLVGRRGACMSFPRM